MLRFLTAGESHGPALVGIVEGLPAGLPISIDGINRDLARRQAGAGAGARMKIEQDQVEITSGVWNGLTIGAPVALRIENLDFKRRVGKPIPVQTIPRPGHADLAGAQKYALDNMTLVAERASARETAMRVAVGSIARQLIGCFDIQVGSYVLAIGRETAAVTPLPYARRFALADLSDVRVYDEPSAERIRACIDTVIRSRDTVGGVIETVALNLPVGLGSHVHWDRKLDGRLAQAVMSIPSVKGVEIGDAFENARRPGTEVQDEILPAASSQVTRPTNRAGGLEGGITNGEPLVIRAAFKPIATTLTPLRSINLTTGAGVLAQYQRSDFCHVPRAGVIVEAVVAWVLAEVLMDKIGGDSLAEMSAHWQAWQSPLPSPHKEGANGA